MLTPTGENCYTLHFPLCVRNTDVVTMLVGLITAPSETTTLTIRHIQSEPVCLNDYRVLHAIFSNNHNIRSVLFHSMPFIRNAAQILVSALVHHRPLNRLMFVNCRFLTYTKQPISTKRACEHLEITNCVLTMGQYHDFVMFLLNNDVDRKFFFCSRQTSLRAIFEVNAHSYAAACA